MSRSIPLVKRTNSCRLPDSAERDRGENSFSLTTTAGGVECMESRIAILKGTTTQRRIHGGILQKRCRVRVEHRIRIKRCLSYHEIIKFSYKIVSTLNTFEEVQ